jgi:glucokinase
MRVDSLQIQFPVLVGDIGGTNARFQIFVDAHADPKNFPNLHTADFASIEDAIQTGVLDKTSIHPRTAILAAAGVIVTDGLEMTNCHWFVKPDRLMHSLQIGGVVLLNDFEAQALAISSLGTKDVVAIGEGHPDIRASRVVVGPGTGLGVAGLVYFCNTWTPVPGEGGHVDMGPRTQRDFEIWPFLEKAGGRISAEQLVCGRGLLNICKAIAQKEERPCDFASPEEITAAAINDADPMASEALELFCCYLGRIAGDLALTFMAKGGVYVAGGISKHIESFLINSGFRREFENKWPHNDLMRTIPTLLITHHSAALAGLAAFARDPSRFGLDLENRQWQL